MKKLSTPDFISFIALFFSCAAIYFVFLGNFYFSFGLILLAFFFDAIDGFIARTLRIESDFGKVLDGYIDVVNYLIYPSLVFFFFFILRKPLDLIIIFMFISTGIFRLARFEVLGIKNKKNKIYYEGLPVFFSHFFVFLSFVIYKIINLDASKIFITFFLPIESFLMIQKFNFPKPKNIITFGLILIFLGFAFIYLGFKNDF